MNSKIDELFRREEARNKMLDRMALKAQERQPAPPTGKAQNMVACKAGQDFASRALAYQQECAAIGLIVTTAAAVSHVMKEGAKK